ncbi:DNA mismatch repair endonuclease MutL [uncultured Gemmiger sp.]|uniref:DNA mismatch repair endonuclease MutL n=1 Tax=uncultured Gemmiger sp. TaxID=1623490 RepID=UPI0025E62DA9|nr:DNA mismatch repair endonuclease MutL [uncultured Gemmiger sp.]
MAEIRVLDKHTAELIAAGEVVERPASVAKELLENSIDAGATQISLAIERGGIRQLQIVDNGSGIEPQYIDKAFIRHATSKIATADDLGHIHTLGFRGEALASIASVARVEVVTRTENDEFACVYRIAGGEEQGIEPGARAVGTTITVNDLFYNTPARMKFLKKDASEGTFVSETVLHAALSHPEISFRFTKDGKQQFITPGDGSLRSAVYAVLGREFARDLLDVDGGDELYHVTGLVTPPRACRASRGAQHFFVNGRYVKNRTMMAALENAYKGTVMQGKFPGGVLMLTMPADLVDVNVHPAKTEIRFARESDVFDAVYRAVRSALATPGSGECRFEMGHTAPEEPKAAAPSPISAAPARTARPVPPPKTDGFKTVSAAEYRAMAGLVRDIPARKLPDTAAALTVESEKPTYQVEARPVTPLAPLASMTGEESVLDILPDIPETEKTSAPQQPAPAEIVPQPEPEQTALSALPQAEQTTLTPPPASEELRLVGEVFKTYIITERGSELCLIDKHAAHERILFEKLAKDYGNVAAQMLLVPVQVNLTAAEKLAVLQNTELLADAGVEVEDFGGATVVVRAVPADVAVDDVEDMLTELAAHLAEGGRDALREKTEWVLHSIACRAAIKAGDRTGSAEMLALAQKIMDGTVPPFCPHGRPCVLKLTRKELEKQFGRLV